MAKVRPGLVLSHWYTLFTNFQTSSLEFYSAVEEALKRREVPSVSTSRINWKEGGLGSARREYLRVKRAELSFDICAAPFGTGFFFSWWLARAQNLWAIVLLLLPLVGIPLVLFIMWTAIAKTSGVILASLLTGLIALVFAPLAFWIFVVVMNRIFPGWDDLLVEVPFVGPLYEPLFKPVTYYKMDTTFMFQEAVRGAVMEVIDSMTTAKGIRGLTELERKPILWGLMK